MYQKIYPEISKILYGRLHHSKSGRLVTVGFTEQLIQAKILSSYLFFLLFQSVSLSKSYLSLSKLVSERRSKAPASTAQRVESLEEQISALQTSIADQIKQSVESAIGNLTQSITAQISSSVEQALKKSGDDLAAVSQRLEGRIDRTRENQDMVLAVVREEQAKFQAEVRSTISGFKIGDTLLSGPRKGSVVGAAPPQMVVSEVPVTGGLTGKRNGEDVNRFNFGDGRQSGGGPTFSRSTNLGGVCWWSRQLEV